MVAVPLFGWEAWAKNNKNKFVFGWVAIAYKAWLGDRFNVAKPTLYAVAYGCFFWHRFLFCAVAQLFYFFSFTIKKSTIQKKKINVLYCVGTKTMTEKQTAPKPSQFIFIIFFALAGGLLFYSNQRERFIFYHFFSSKGFGKVSMCYGGASNYQGTLTIYQGGVSKGYFSISIYQGKVSNGQGGISKGYFLVSMYQCNISNCQGRVSKGYKSISKGYKVNSKGFSKTKKASDGKPFNRF